MWYNVGHVQVSVKCAAVVADTKVLVLLRQVLQEVLNNQPIELFEA